MLEHLSVKTSTLISEIADGRKIVLGDEDLEVFKQDEINFLGLISSQLSFFEESVKTNDLPEIILEKLPNKNFSPKTIKLSSKQTLHSNTRIRRVRAEGFRGLAPADIEWEIDFAKKSHLLFGPNGSGKSSLIGSICWCLTGMLIRDDQPPSQPENIKTYSTQKTPKTLKSRPVGLSLMNSDGTNTSFDQPFRVDVELKSSTSETFWIRRHSVDGLSTSKDGNCWSKIDCISEAGISPLDAELSFIMPARVPHIRFGKESDLLSIFTKIAGYGELERIIEVSNRARSATTKKINQISKDISELHKKILESQSTVGDFVKSDYSELESSLCNFQEKLSLEKVEIFQKNLKQLSEKVKQELLQHLDIKTTKTTDLEIDEKLNFLPGFLKAVQTKLEKPLNQLFPTSLNLALPNGKELNELKSSLTTLEIKLREESEKRLEWAFRCKNEDTCSDLLLMAGSQFSKKLENCPVCEQSLKSVPKIRKNLEKFSDLSKNNYLYKSIEDLDLFFTNELNGLVSPAKRSIAESSFKERILYDWTNLKNDCFSDFLQSASERIDAHIHSTTNISKPTKKPSLLPLNKKYQDSFPNSFKNTEKTLKEIHAYLLFVEDFHLSIQQINTEIEALFREESSDGGFDSLLNIICQEMKRVQNHHRLVQMQHETEKLVQWVKETKTLSSKEKQFQKLGIWCDQIKSLSGPIRKEIVALMKKLEPKLKQYYRSLYDDDALLFDTATPGHLANPSIKNEFNVYFLADEERIPTAPFINAGRIRAISISFMFALLEESSGSLGVILMDDPAISLDDEHKARLLDWLISPKLVEQQIILTTHYENFSKQAEAIFSEEERLQLVPRRSPSDAVAFEPSDLLQRLQETISKRGCSWREMGINIRRWGERVLSTLSGYCPEPFIIFNNIPDSVKAYKEIKDPQVATQERDFIVSAFESHQFNRIMHRIAHDEEPTETEVRDCLTKLSESRKYFEKVLKKFKKIQKHKALGRGINPHPVVLMLPKKEKLAQTSFYITGEAAASGNSVGVSWELNELSTLDDYSLAIAKSQTIFPVALEGNYLLLDPMDDIPADGDIVVVETEQKERYFRKFWNDPKGGIHLEAINNYTSHRPLYFSRGGYKARKVLGVLYETPHSFPKIKPEEEWVFADNLPDHILKNIMGVKVRGTSLEPLARNDQIVLVKKDFPIENFVSGMLACVDIETRGAVIKKCYPDKEEWVLNPINATNNETPIRVNSSEILHLYPVVGVLFQIPLKE